MTEGSLSDVVERLTKQCHTDYKLQLNLNGYKVCCLKDKHDCIYLSRYRKWYFDWNPFKIKAFYLCNHGPEKTTYLR